MHLPDAERQPACIQCDRAFRSDEARFRINDRAWCRPCTNAYRTSAAGDGLRAGGLVLLAMVAGVGAYLAASALFSAQMGLLLAGAAVASVLVSRLFRHRVDVHELPPLRQVAFTAARAARSGLTWR
jgi:hypothetical protein